VLCFFKKFLTCFLVIFAFLLCETAVVFSDARGGESNIPFSEEDDLAQIRDKIVANGYQFTVSCNWVFALPRERRVQMRSRYFPVGPRLERGSFGLGPLAEYLGSPLPDRFDWRNVDNGLSYIGPIRQQGSCGACYAFGACAAAEGVYNFATNSFNDSCVDFSEAFITFCLDPLYDGFDGCRGSDYEYSELDGLTREGVCFEELFPYNPALRRCSLELSVPTVKFDSWHRLPCNDIVAIKTAIRYFGVIDVSVLTNRAFDAYESGIYEDSMTQCQDVYSGLCYYATTDHVVSLVGWDDNSGEGYWILRNSWGADWGEGGYMRIKYNAAHVTCAACYLALTVEPPPLVPVKPIAVAPWLPLLLGE